MLPFAHGVDWMVEDRKYSSRSSSSSKNLSTAKRSMGKDKDHEIVVIPLSPSRSAGAIFHHLFKSRLAWLIVFLILVFITLSYHAYEERMKQLRLLEYMERMEELKVSMTRVKHHIIAGNNRLQELKHVYASIRNNRSSANG